MSRNSPAHLAWIGSALAGALFALRATQFVRHDLELHQAELFPIWVSVCLLLLSALLMVNFALHFASIHQRAQIGEDRGRRWAAAVAGFCCFGFALSSVAALTLWPAVAGADPCDAPLPSSGAAFAGRVTHVLGANSLCVGANDGGVEVQLREIENCRSGRAGHSPGRVKASIYLGAKVECIAQRRAFDSVVASCKCLTP